MDSPGDNTAVIRMKREFDAFVSASRKRHLQRSFNVNQAENDEETTSSSPAVSMRNLLDKEKEEKLMKAEVITAKSMIVKLEAEVDNLRRSNKRTRIEYDKDLGNLTSEKQRELEKAGELKSRLQYLADREKTAREELQELRRESELRAATAEEKQLVLQKDKLQLEEDLQQANEQSWEKITELRNQSMRTQMELQICQTELEETKAQLKLQLKRSAETTAHLKELEDFRLRAVQAEQKIKDLEDQESLHQEDVTITRALKTQLENLPDLERELEKLKEDNKYYKETEKNTLLLEEQIDGLTRKLQRAEDRMADYTQMQLDNESLKINLERWQGKSAAGVGNPLSPTELSQQVVELQSAQMLARDEYGKLQSRFQSLQAELRETTSKYQTAVQEASAGKTGSQQQQDLIKRLQRKLLLVSKEREGYKRILDSYESEVTVNVGALQASRVQQLEQLLHDYRTQTESLEAELGRTAHEVSQTKTKCLQLETQTDGGGRAALAAKCDQRTIQELKERVIELELEVEKKNRQADVLEAWIEQRKLQGDYDPSKTKVVHFTMNPAEIAQRHREEEMKRLQDENDKLKQRLKLLEESGGSVEDLTQKVEKKLQEPDVSKEVEELKSQLTREELRNKRLMEAFKKTSQEFREVCYQLTGYKIDIPCASQYRLTNMYADSPQDYLLFAHGSSGETQMLQTAFSETVQDLIDLYLAKQDNVSNGVPGQNIGSRDVSNGVPGQNIGSRDVSNGVPGQNIGSRDVSNGVPGQNIGSRDVLNGVPGQNIGSRDVSNGVPGQNIGSRDVSNGVPGQNIGSLDVSNGVPGQNIGSRDVSNGVPGQNIGSRDVSNGVPGQNIGSRDVSNGVPGQNIGSRDVSNGVPGQNIGSRDVSNGVPGQNIGSRDVSNGVPGQNIGSLDVSNGVPG